MGSLRAGRARVVRTRGNARGECEIPRDSVASSLGRYGSSEKRVKQNSLSATRLSLHARRSRIEAVARGARRFVYRAVNGLSCVCRSGFRPKSGKTARRTRSSDANPLRMKMACTARATRGFTRRREYVTLDSAKKVARDRIVLISLRGLIPTSATRFLREAGGVLGSQFFRAHFYVSATPRPWPYPIQSSAAQPNDRRGRAGPSSLRGNTKQKAKTTLQLATPLLLPRRRQALREQSEAIVLLLLRLRGAPGKANE